MFQFKDLKSSWKWCQILGISEILRNDIKFLELLKISKNFLGSGLKIYTRLQTKVCLFVIFNIYLYFLLILRKFFSKCKWSNFIIFIYSILILILSSKFVCTHISLFYTTLNLFRNIQEMVLIFNSYYDFKKVISLITNRWHW